jgi:hypothetical protein
MHTAALQPRLDQYFVGALRAAAANRVAGCLERRVLDLGQALGEVRHRAIARLRRQMRIDRGVDRQVCHG